jgi:hypothetical protein
MEPNPHDQNPTLPLVDQEGPESRPLASDAPDLHQRVEDLDSVVRGLSRTVSAEARTHGGSSGQASVAGQRFSPVVQREELGELADWVDFYQEYYDLDRMWLYSCWWRHPMVVQELAALRGAWMAIYQSDEPVHGAAALQWHEAAVRCRSRIREAITNGAGCLHNSHRPQWLMSDSAFWVEEGQALRRWVTEGGSDEERKGTETRDW